MRHIFPMILILALSSCKTTDKMHIEKFEGVELSTMQECLDFEFEVYDIKDTCGGLSHNPSKRVKGSINRRDTIKQQTHFTDSNTYNSFRAPSFKVDNSFCQIYKFITVFLIIFFIVLLLRQRS